MKQRVLGFLFVLGGFSVNAQIEREEPQNPVGPQIQIAQQRIMGKVVDQNTGRGLEAASVQLYMYSSAGSDSLIRGQFTKGNGEFVFEGLPQADSFRVAITGIGYTPWTRVVTLSQAGFTDLGNVSITPESQVLGNVVITTQQRPALQMGIDRKVFTVENNITASGGTALDVMRNIPSVSVDAEGSVQLRNAQPQIFIDGRPTILTPDQIPADQIERIELITNPSAKFDASSSAGIINIVMKRNRRMGLNGIATIGGGHPSILNGNLSVNARQGKVNLFATGGYNQSGGLARGRTFRQNKRNGLVEDYFNQYSATDRMRRFRSIRFGLDFFASIRNTLSLTQNIVKGTFSNEQTQDQEYLNQNKTLERFGFRSANSESEFERYNTQLNYIHRFPKQGQQLSANLNYSNGSGNEASNIVNSFFRPDGTLYSVPARVRNAGRNNNDQYTFEVDYTNPLGENSKFEAGARTFTNKQKSYFSSFSLLNGSETLLPLSNNYAYSETVNAAYLSFSNKINTFGYQLGLRAEVSRFEGELIDSAKKFGYDYPRSANRFFDALFPSVFLTKQAGEGAELQVNYTRRIRRPNFWQLNPFIDINDPVNLRQGNPQLQPEFVNSFEFNYSQNYQKGNFLGVVYYRNNLRDITRFSDTISTSLYQQLNNAAIDPNAILNTFINARSTNRLGMELTLQHRFTPQFDIVPTIDMQYRKVNADEYRLSNSGFNWDAELTANLRFAAQSGLLKDLGLQLVGEYESEEVTVQGRNAAQYQLDFGLRKEFLKDKRGTISFNINDIFNSQRFGNIYDTDNFFQESYFRRNVRSFRINFTYKFGSDDFKVFGRDNRRNDNGDDD
jgi:outer membrane receptor protein involved in Fe transport